MPPKCKLKTGGANPGIGPKGCTYQTDAQGNALRSRSAATTGGAADTVTVAKQRYTGPANAADKGIRRRVRVTYQGKTKIMPKKYLLDTGAATIEPQQVLMSKKDLESILPPQGNYASKWARFRALNNLPTLSMSGVVPGASKTGYQANVTFEVEINVGAKNSGQMEWRGGPVRAMIMAGSEGLVGLRFLKHHRIIVKG